MLPRLEHYHIFEKIAEGGTATIYRGYNRLYGHEVAIKQLHRRFMDKSDISVTIQALFVQEAQLYMKLEYEPSITKLDNFIHNEYDPSDKGYYIAMEFIEGETLQDYINRHGLLPEEYAIPIFYQILDAVQAVHNQNAIHRDIKTNNIMIRKDGVVKLLDLGIAARLNDYNQMGAGFGTIAYMPPEQKERGATGRYTDIFALGVVLFEMLTGKVPFWGNNAQETAWKIKNVPAPSLRSYYPFINERTQSVINKALAKSGHDRYQSCIEFKNDLIKIYGER